MSPSLTGTRSGAAAGAAGLVGEILLTTVLGLVFGYIAVAAVVNFAREDQFSAALAFDRLRRILTSTEYAIRWLLSVGVLVGAAIIGGFFNILPIIGTLTGALVLFYAQIVAANLWTEGYKAALEFEYDEDRRNVEETVA